MALLSVVFHPPNGRSFAAPTGFYVPGQQLTLQHCWILCLNPLLLISYLQAIFQLRGWASYTDLPLALWLSTGLMTLLFYFTDDRLDGMLYLAPGFQLRTL